MALESTEGLGRAESAKGALGRGVGGDSFGANADAGPVVGATGVNGAAREDYGRESFVGAAGDGEVNFAAEDFAVFGDGGAMAGAGRVALGGCDHILGAVVDKLDWLAGFPREQRRVAGDH